jgi:hypothetical protein
MPPELRWQPTPPRIHPRYILPLTCNYLAVSDTGPRVRGPDVPHAGQTRGGMPGNPGWPLSRQHGGVAGPTGRITPTTTSPPCRVAPTRQDVKADYETS